jgi:methylenetetrahydrofolate reductase (NADPH)
MVQELTQKRSTSPMSGVARVAADLIASGSLEMSPHRPGDAEAIAALLPAATAIFVNHLPRYSLEQSLETLIAIREAGLQGVPHLAARRITSRAEARVFLERAVRLAGVQRILVVGGDTAGAAGPYGSGLDVLEDGLLGECGVHEVALPGYPEGHPGISQHVLNEDLERKLDAAGAQKLGVSIVTQFSFAPVRIINYCAELERKAPGVPVFVGLPGPTTPLRLLRLAQICGVSASLRALQSHGVRAIGAITHTDPAEQLKAIASYCASRASSNIVGAHIFSFGGAVAAAAWMNRCITERQGIVPTPSAQ